MIRITKMNKSIIFYSSIGPRVANRLNRPDLYITSFSALILSITFLDENLRRAKSGGSYPTPAKQSATPGTGAAARNLNLEF